MEASVPNPTDGIKGNGCPVGHYCPLGSSDKQPCSMGYYLDVTLQTDLSDCKLCPGGQYCAGSGLELPTGNCSAGYYCPGGQNMSMPTEYK